jgi:hypothetical protein
MDLLLLLGRIMVKSRPLEPSLPKLQPSQLSVPPRVPRANPQRATLFVTGESHAGNLILNCHLIVIIYSDLFKWDRPALMTMPSLIGQPVRYTFARVLATSFRKQRSCCTKSKNADVERIAAGRAQSPNRDGFAILENAATSMAPSTISCRAEDARAWGAWQCTANH